MYHMPARHVRHGRCVGVHSVSRGGLRRVVGSELEHVLGTVCAGELLRRWRRGVCRVRPGHVHRNRRPRLVLPVRQQHVLPSRRRRLHRLPRRPVQRARRGGVHDVSLWQLLLFWSKLHRVWARPVHVEPSDRVRQLSRCKHESTLMVCASAAVVGSLQRSYLSVCGGVCCIFRGSRTVLQHVIYQCLLRLRPWHDLVWRKLDLHGVQRRGGLGKRLCVCALHGCVVRWGGEGRSCMEGS